MVRFLSPSILLLFGSKQLYQARYKDHDHLRNYDEIDEEKAVEQRLWLNGKWQAVDVIKTHGGESQAQRSGGPGESPSFGLPVLRQAQAQNGTTVTSE